MWRTRQWPRWQTISYSSTGREGGAKSLASGVSIPRSSLGSFRCLFARRLPNCALPSSCFLPAFSGGFAPGPRPVALVAFTGFDFGRGTLPPIGSKAPAYVVGVNERRARLLRRTYRLSVPVSIIPMLIRRSVSPLSPRSIPNRDPVLSPCHPCGGVARQPRGRTLLLAVPVL
jgi:hypothetical protein